MSNKNPAEAGSLSRFRFVSIPRVTRSAITNLSSKVKSVSRKEKTHQEWVLKAREPKKN